MKNLNIKIKLNKTNQKSRWEKAIFGALLISILIFSSLIVFIVIKPVSKGLREIIDHEISSIDINFDTKTIEMLKKRQEPQSTTAPTVGKNPFLPF